MTFFKRLSLVGMLTLAVLALAKPPVAMKPSKKPSKKLYKKKDEKRLRKTKAKTEIRCAFDIGSGATKLKVAKVHTGYQTKKILLESKQDGDGFERAIAFAANYDKITGIFLPTIQTEGIRTLNAMLVQAKTELKKLGVKSDMQCIGVATAIFREALAKNPHATKKLLKDIEAQTKIKISIISQHEEALLGYYGAQFALQKTNINPENILMWDVGGASMQFAAHENTNDKDIYFGGQQASEPTLQMALSLKSLPPQTKSPNPIGKTHAQKIEKKLESEALKVGKHIREKIKKPETIVVGVGPLHRYSIQGQSRNGQNSYSLSDVKKALDERIDLSDQALVEFNEFGKVLSKAAREKLDDKSKKKLVKKAKYARTDVINLLLIYSYMKSLNIKKVRTSKVNLSEGALVSPKYWSKRD